MEMSRASTLMQALQPLERLVGMVRALYVDILIGQGVVPSQRLLGAF
jgi:hypothetical protein